MTIGLNETFYGVLNIAGLNIPFERPNGDKNGNITIQ